MTVDRTAAADIGPSFGLMVAAYNAESTLADALESVLRQCYERWKVVVVDDGSTDTTLAIAQEYASRDERFEVIAQTNAGSGAARNAAIRVIDTDFIGYLDADDMLADHHMTTMLEMMRESPGYDVYSSDGVFVHEDGSRELVFNYGKTVFLTIEDMLKECRILGGGALVRAEVLRAVGGFREHMYGEDYDLWLRVLASGYRHVGSPEPLYIYHRCIAGQKSEDPEAGCESAVNALSDLIESGLLTDGQKRQATESIVNHLAGPRLEVQAQRLRSAVVDVVGERWAQPVMRVIHSVSWAVRPIRRWLAARR